MSSQPPIVTATTGGAGDAGLIPRLNAAGLLDDTMMPADIVSTVSQNAAYWPSTANALSNGVAQIAGLVGGSGGTNGTFALAFSGGGGSGAAGSFTVVGGVVVSTVMRYAGVGYTSAPAVSFAACSGLTGASAVAQYAPNVALGGYFKVPVTGGYNLYQVQAGPAAVQIGNTFPDNTGIASLVSTVTGSPAYANPGGTGNRKSSVTVTASAGLIIAGTPPNLVDGDTSSSSSANSIEFGAVAVAGLWLLFDFGEDAARVVTEATWYQSGANGHGTWQWSGSNDGVTFTAIGGTFTLGGATTQIQASLAVNSTPYRYYQLLGVSGSASASPYIGEVQFKIGPAQGDGKAALAELLAYKQAQIFPAGFPTSKLISAYFFDPSGINGTNVVDQFGSNPINLTAATSPNYTPNGHGIRLAAGLIQLPTILGMRSYTLLNRCDKDGTTGFLFSGEGQNSGGGVLQALVPTTGTTLYGGSGVDLHAPIYNTTNSPGTACTELNRGNWGSLHREMAAADTSFAYAIGGRAATTTSRCADFEVNALFLWNAPLTTAERAVVHLYIRARALKFGIFLHSNDCPVKDDVYIVMGESTASGRANLLELPAAKQSRLFASTFITPWGGGGSVYPWQPLKMGLNQQVPESSALYSANSFAQYRANNFSNGDTLKVGSQTYTWKVSLTGAANEVLIGANFAASAANFVAALTAGTGAGSTYGTGTTANASATGYVPTGGTSIVAMALAAGATSVAVSYTPVGSTVAGVWGDGFLDAGRSGGVTPTYPDSLSIEYGIATQREAALLSGAKRRPCRIIKPGKGSTFFAPSSTGYAGSASASWNAGENVGNGCLTQAITHIQQGLQDMIAQGIGFGSINLDLLMGLNDSQSTTYAPDATTYQGYVQASFNVLAGVLPGVVIGGAVFLPHTHDPAGNATAQGYVRTGLAAFAGANGLASVDTQSFGLEPDSVHYNADANLSMGVTAHG
jgi:hypothetical protein